MLIGIDGNEANIKARVGVNQYAWELLKSMHELIAEGARKHQVIVYLKNPPLSDMPLESNFWHYKVLPGAGFWIIRKLMVELFFSSNKPEIFLTPSHYLPPFAPMPRICTITDLGYLEFSGQFKKSDFWQLKYWSAWSIKVAKSILAISESTKKDIVRHYPFASKKVNVTLLGYDDEKFNLNISKEDVRRALKKYSIVNSEKEYVLFLSTLKPSKNVSGLIEAWSKISREFGQYKLIIAGKKGWLYDDIFAKVNELGLQKNIIFTDFVEEKDKPYLIAGAKVFVLPSFWEGFGLDPLNAMACGVPTIVSNVASLPEVVGDAGILIDPYNVDSITKALKKVLSMSKTDYDRICKKSVSQAKNFSWSKTASETFDVLERSMV